MCWSQVVAVLHNEVGLGSIKGDLRATQSYKARSCCLLHDALHAACYCTVSSFIFKRIMLELGRSPVRFEQLAYRYKGRDNEGSQALREAACHPTICVKLLATPRSV